MRLRLRIVPGRCMLRTEANNLVKGERDDAQAQAQAQAADVLSLMSLPGREPWMRTASRMNL
jgi:hypothetical protein